MVRRAALLPPMLAQLISRSRHELHRDGSQGKQASSNIPVATSNLARSGKLPTTSLGDVRRVKCRRLPMAPTTSTSILQHNRSPRLISTLSALLNEIMPMIYKRFTEKAAEEWRQIYKALQLLEFLIKNGSERVIDDARGHLTLLKMLRQFHYIDQNGKDQGVNVRNRADELAKLLSDVDKIRAERKKARANRSKYSGVEGGGGMGMSGNRYGGFGSNDNSTTFGGYSGGVYGDGGGFGGQSSDFQDAGHRGEPTSSTSATSRRDRFDEYDEYDEGAVAAPGRRQVDSSHSSTRTKRTTEAAKPSPPVKKAPEVDLFSFDDPTPTSLPAMAPAASSNTADDDDFDDFQSAAPLAALPSASTTTASAPLVAPQPVSAPQKADLAGLVGLSSISPPPNNATANYSAFAPPSNGSMMQQAPPPSGYQGAQINYFTSVPAPSSQSSSAATPAPSVKTPATKSTSGGDAFGSLWSTASVGIKKTGPAASGPALGQLAKEKASAGIWGAPSTPSMGTQQKPAGSQQTLGNGLDDLLG